MSDLIYRHDALEAMSRISDSICEAEAVDALCEVPTIELIRCKDCKHRVLINHVWRCLYSDFIVPEHYCGYAERKE